MVEEQTDLSAAQQVGHLFVTISLLLLLSLLLIPSLLLLLYVSSDTYSN